MFVMISTQGPARQTVKTVAELPFYRDHYKYMRQVFETGQLLMGGPFLDNQVPEAFSISRTKRRRAKSLHTIPLCRRGRLNRTCIPGMPPSISIKRATLHQEADGKIVKRREKSIKQNFGPPPHLEE